MLHAEACATLALFPDFAIASRGKKGMLWVIVL
jgi:hypothetical protein